MHKLMIISASTREGRKGDAVARWIEGEIRKDAEWDVSLADLKELNLPMLDEPEHPRFGKYKFEHTKAWSALVASAEAFVVVTPEYNFFAPPSLVNAFDYLSREWAYKPLAFVSYGGVSAGTRAVQTIKQLATTLKLVPLVEAVALPFFAQYIDAEGKFTPGELSDTAAAVMLAELKKWTVSLKAMR